MADPDIKLVIRAPTSLRAKLNQACANATATRGKRVTQADMIGELLEKWRNDTR